MPGSGRRRAVRAVLAIAAAVGGPVALTGPLLSISSRPREYVFVYLAYVAVIGVLGGLWPALLAAGAGFLLADYYFVPPVRTLTLFDEFDLVNLTMLAGTALLVGGLVSRRRRAQRRAVALAGELSLANAELVRRNRDQEEAARVALELERTQRQVHILEETDRARQDLLANVSHELRTPLASILTGSTALLGRADLAPARDELASIAAEARRLGRLVGDMLDMARIEGGALDLQREPTDAAEAVQAAVDRLHRHSPGRPVAWDGEGAAGVRVLADWDRLAQILDNLLGNADRLAPPGTPLTVDVGAGGGAVVIGVADHGPGVPAEHRERIFDRFVRGDGAAPGTGLGLAIVRGLVEAQGGRVWFEDAPGGGARFAFSLPVPG
ncbi:MAG TPA: HAMP domain-containing sensor histidine kinase [Candidatus Dormibacteraeota bacterium]|jgi:K+-sensing histidine kinase KdpD